MSANDRKIPHYDTAYQHWDLVIRVGMGYLEGCSTKYVARWRKKDRINDLFKAQHYLDKLIESYEIKYVRVPRHLTHDLITKEVTRFVLINDLDQLEQEYIHTLSTYTNRIDLQAAKLVLEEIIENAQIMLVSDEPNRPGTPEDGGHHAAGSDEMVELEAKQKGKGSLHR